MELRHTADREGVLSSFLRKEMGMSSGLMNRLKWKERILVNGVPQFTNYPVKPGDLITALLDEPEPQYPPEEGPLEILYEDADILAVDKPAGMLIHPSRARMTGTLANLVLGYYQKTGQSCAFHPVTRLDRDTYGIVLLAKNSHIHSLLQSQQSMKKVYHALVLGGPERDTGLIDAPIARLPLPSLLRQVQPDGKPSRTRYTVLERRETVTKLELEPLTGRTHQLRVHCAYMGFPILGDPQYGTALTGGVSRRMGLSSQLLCASRLELIHPVTGCSLVLESCMDAEPQRQKTV